MMNTNSAPQTPTWIFAAQDRLDRKNKMEKIRVAAETEKEARRQLAGQYICVFLGCIRQN